MQDNPDYSAIISANAHYELEYTLSIATQGYDTYPVKIGDNVIFTRNGDNGFINWAMKNTFTEVSTQKSWNFTNCEQA